MPKGGRRGGRPGDTILRMTPVEDSNVVFGAAKQNPKMGQYARATKEGQQVAQTSDAIGPSKPSTRELIGGVSWTGKLPVNILSEHCQKQKWAKPEYSMTRSEDGFSSVVTLKHVNPRSKEIMVLPAFKLPPSHKHLATAPTAIEARHFAATYTLFRICSMRNIHMMLPPSYKDLWKKEFQDLKRNDVKEGKGWMYEADPFTTRKEREEAQASMTRKKVHNEEKVRATTTAESPILLDFERPGGTGDARDATDARQKRTAGKDWLHAPKIDMGKRTRVDVEQLIRIKTEWNPDGLQISPSRRRDIVNEFTDLGFRRSHAEEALDECRDREEALEWLLIHIPEDDLPQWSLPGGYTAGLSIASANLKREAAVTRLSRTGYSNELCEMYLDVSEGDEAKAAQQLQQALVPDKKSRPENQGSSTLRCGNDRFDNLIPWSEEQETLKAILGNRLHRISHDLYEVELQILKLEASFTLSARVSECYPNAPPVLCLLAPAIPAYIRLSITRKVIEYAQRELLGGPMIFDIIDWLETHISEVIANPGKLKDVSQVICGESKTQVTRYSIGRQRQHKHPDPIPWDSHCPVNIEIYNRWKARQATAKQQSMLAIRQSLPAWDLRDEIVSTVSNHQVTIITGETGSGKSTQAVQFILDDMIQQKLGAFANILCTQPRRISAISLADRLSQERVSVIGDEVGYVIRGESKQTSGVTKITFMTTGVLLRRLQTSGGSKEDTIKAVADVSHVIVDEVHERTLDTDFLLILLRDILAWRRDLRVILMSATLHADAFEDYFSGTTTVGRVEICGRTYPVEDYYLDDVVRLTGYDGGVKLQRGDDAEEGGSASRIGPSIGDLAQHIGTRINYGLIARTVAAIDSQLDGRDGGILIFVPGIVDINHVLDAVHKLDNIHALPLHASLTSVEQKRVFLRAPRGKRKVIASTNIAETSITIEDICAVIDTGKVKETSFDPQSCMVKLEEVWASRAACRQRRGRAGRVQAGTCYKLYTRNAEAKMAAQPEPEIRRLPLEQLCLSVRALGIRDVSAFLNSALTPPEGVAVEGALNLLSRMGAVDGNELTALGKHLSMIPADLRCGKLLVYGAVFRCLEAACIIAATLTVRSPFLSPQNKREESKAARTAFAPGQGDLICDLRAYEEWSSRLSGSSYHDTRLWCDTNFICFQTLNDIASSRAQYISSLVEAGFVPSDYQLHYRKPSTSSTSLLNAQSANYALLRALIAGAFYPQVARIDFPDKKFAPSHSGAVELDPEARTIKFLSQDAGRVFIHPSSTLFSAEKFPGGSVYMAYFNRMSTSKVFIKEITPFNAYAALLFGGPVHIDTTGQGVIVDGWLRMKGWARIGVLVSRLRRILDISLRRKIENPGAGGNEEDEVVKVVRQLVEYDGLDR